MKPPKMRTLEDASIERHTVAIEAHWTDGHCVRVTREIEGTRTQALKRGLKLARRWRGEHGERAISREAYFFGRHNTH